MAEYHLRCLATGARLPDNYTNRYHERALLRTEYETGPLRTTNRSGVWRWAEWLPVSGPLEHSAGTVVYRSEHLAEALGLEELWIAYHGYWPERDGSCPTGTFKDLEALPTLRRLKDHDIPGLICASAGNTARAFAYFGGLEGYPVLLVVAERHLERVWVPEGHPTDTISLIGIRDGTYNDAIDVTGAILEEGGWRREGGVYNVARRDGIATLLLEALQAAGSLPVHYFQGVGGGPGPIGVHETALRIVNSGMAKGPVPQQHLSQNAAFCPVHRAWQAGRPFLVAEDMPDTDEAVFSDYLVNRTPAWSLRGGLYDVLTESRGRTYAVSTVEALEASGLFQETEGIDLLSPAAVSLASLRQAVADGAVGSSESVLLNVSGGGHQRMRREIALRTLDPVMIGGPAEAVEAGLAIVRGAAS